MTSTYFHLRRAAAADSFLRIRLSACLGVAALCACNARPSPTTSSHVRSEQEHSANKSVVRVNEAAVWTVDSVRAALPEDGVFRVLDGETLIMATDMDEPAARGLLHELKSVRDSIARELFEG